MLQRRVNQIPLLLSLAQPCGQGLHFKFTNASTQSADLVIGLWAENFGSIDHQNYLAL